MGSKGDVSCAYEIVVFYVDDSIQIMLISS